MDLAALRRAEGGDRAMGKKLHRPSRTEESPGTGFSGLSIIGALAYLVLALGLAGLLYASVIKGVVGALALLGLWRGRRAWAEPGARPPSAGPGPQELGPGWRAVFTCLLAGAAIALVPFVLMPEIFWDAMVYHLGIPRLYLLEHRMLPTPANLYSGNVLTVQMLFTAALALEGPVTAKLLNAAVGLAHVQFFASWALRWRAPGAGLLGAAVLAAGVLIALHPPPWPEDFWAVACGRKSESDFLSLGRTTLYPGPPQAGVRFINETAAPEAKVLLVGDPRGLYLERPFYATGQFDVEILERLCNCSGGPEEVRARLKGCGVAYILVNHAELQRLHQGLRFTLEGAAVFEAFWRACTEKVFDEPAYPDHWVAVFRLLDAGQRPDPKKVEPIFGPFRRP
ncbi:MAG: hypothetical protein HY748_11350 [Elusimicrobia bacterium]|nr:hypothetical protein [Elusimicrobiota bacterium]